MKNNNKVLLMVLGVLLVIGVGVSFAYFAVNVAINGDGANVNLGTNNFLKVQYDAGSGKLDSDSFFPGNKISKEFKVIVTPTNTQKEATYRIYMNITQNTFTKCNDTNFDAVTNNCELDAQEIIYRLKDSDGTIIKTGDLTNSVTGEIELLRTTKTQDVKSEYTYIVEVEYIDTNKDQNHNKNAVINGEVKVEFVEKDETIPVIDDVTTSVTKTEITVTVSASDDKGVTEYWYQLDSNAAVKQTTNTYKFTGLTAGSSHTVKVYVKDAAGNQSTTTTKTVTTTPEGQTSSSIIAGITVKPGSPNFKSAATADEGVYSVSDPVYGGTSYYWRGAVTNNYVRFANFCWRIVRINGDGSIRLIYDGTTCHPNGTSTADSIAKTSQTYNASYNQSNYVGWTYSGTSQRTLSGTASNAKTQTESWFDANITGTNLAKVDTSAKFCNDRNTASGSTWAISPSSTFYYAAYKRAYTDYAPILSCPSEDTYPLKVGAITADEVMYAGGYTGAQNKNYYLYNGQNYWTMSPSYWNSDNSQAYVFFVRGSDGFLADVGVHWTNAGLRPVINLKADTFFATGGNGTQSNPYVVS